MRRWCYTARRCSCTRKIFKIKKYPKHQEKLLRYILKTHTIVKTGFHVKKASCVNHSFQSNSIDFLVKYLLIYILYIIVRNTYQCIPNSLTWKLFNFTWLNTWQRLTINHGLQFLFSWSNWRNEKNFFETFYGIAIHCFRKVITWWVKVLNQPFV